MTYWSDWFWKKTQEKLLNDRIYNRNMCLDEKNHGRNFWLKNISDYFLNHWSWFWENSPNLRTAVVRKKKIQSLKPFTKSSEKKCFALTPQANFHDHNLNFHRRWRWWDRIKAIFLNLLYFIYFFWKSFEKNNKILTKF